MPQLPDRGAATPLWQQVHDDLERRIHAGEFATGMPGEPALAGEYRVSRHTVREALRGLRSDGLVISRQGHTSIVNASLTYEVIRDEVVADPAIAAELDLPAGAPLRWEERIWRRGGGAVAKQIIVQPATASELMRFTDTR